MEHSYYGRLDVDKPHFTIGQFMIDEHMRKLFEVETNKMKAEIRKYFNDYKKDYEHDLIKMKKFIENMEKTFGIVDNRKPRVKDFKKFSNVTKPEVVEEEDNDY